MMPQIKTTLEPLADRVIVEPAVPENKTVGGLYIPDIAQESTAKGKVVARGPDCFRVMVDDMVYYGRYSGSEVEFGGAKFIVLRESDLIARERSESTPF